MSLTSKDESEQPRQTILQDPASTELLNSFPVLHSYGQTALLSDLKQKDGNRHHIGRKCQKWKSNQYPLR